MVMIAVLVNHDHYVRWGNPMISNEFKYVPAGTELASQFNINKLNRPR